MQINHILKNIFFYSQQDLSNAHHLFQIFPNSKRESYLNFSTKFGNYEAQNICHVLTLELPVGANASFAISQETLSKIVCHN